MSRRARLVYPDIPLHIIQRGNNRAACFVCDTDYQVYLSMLRDSAHDHRCAVHAYVLMTNHVHLLVTPTVASAAAAMMKGLGQHYAQYINRRYNRTGSLWEGRFRSSIVQGDRYFLTCQRYIELNPVRAGMVDDPGHYAWSSHRSNAYGHVNAMLIPHETFLALGATAIARNVNYRALFAEPIAADTLARIRTAGNGNFVLGTSDFAAGLAAHFDCHTEPQRRGRRHR